MARRKQFNFDAIVSSVVLLGGVASKMKKIKKRFLPDELWESNASNCRHEIMTKLFCLYACLSIPLRKLYTFPVREAQAGKCVWSLAPSVLHAARAFALTYEAWFWVSSLDAYICTARVGCKRASFPLQKCLLFQYVLIYLVQFCVCLPIQLLGLVWKEVIMY